MENHVPNSLLVPLRSEESGSPMILKRTAEKQQLLVRQINSMKETTKQLLNLKVRELASIESLRQNITEVEVATRKIMSETSVNRLSKLSTKANIIATSIKRMRMQVIELRHDFISNRDSFMKDFHEFHKEFLARLQEMDQCKECKQLSISDPIIQEAKECSHMAFADWMLGNCLDLAK